MRKINHMVAFLVITLLLAVMLDLLRPQFRRSEVSILGVTPLFLLFEAQDLSPLSHSIFSCGQPSHGFLCTPHVLGKEG